MAHTFGSLRHTTSGRRRKPLPKKRKAYMPKFEALEATDTYRRDTTEYKSSDDGSHDTSAGVRHELDSKYTIAPAYNKGAYQVISKDNIKDIGR